MHKNDFVAATPPQTRCGSLQQRFSDPLARFGRKVGKRREREKGEKRGGKKRRKRTRSGEEKRREGKGREGVGCVDATWGRLLPGAEKDVGPCTNLRDTPRFKPDIENCITTFGPQFSLHTDSTHFRSITGRPVRMTHDTWTACQSA